MKKNIKKEKWFDYLTKKNTFLDQTKKGKSSWWRYLVGIEMASTLTVILPILIILLFNIIYPSTSNLELSDCETIEISPEHYETNCSYKFDFFGSTSPLFQLIFLFSLFPLSIINLWIALHWLHQRTLSSIISWNGKFRWRRFFLGLGGMFFLALVFFVINYVLFPDNFELIWEWKWFLYLIPVIIIVGIQALAEELFFRGYLTQTVGYFTRKNFFILVLPSLLFALSHGYNPEVKSFGFTIMLIYFTIGLFLSLITLLDQGLEIAFGFHLANNLFSGMFISYQSSVIDFLPAIFRQKEVFIQFEFLILILSLILFMFIVYRKRIKKS